MFFAMLFCGEKAWYTESDNSEVVGIKNMELRLLRYFLTVAKEQSFTKAAEQLHITQPTLSRQMAAFEEDLGITLFIRNGKKISLTDE